MPRSLGIDTDDLMSRGVNTPPNDLGSDDSSSRIRCVGIEMLCADYRGFFYERPLMTVSIVEPALDNSRLGFVANIADYGYPDSEHAASSLKRVLPDPSLQTYFTPFSGFHEPCALRTNTICPM